MPRPRILNAEPEGYSDRARAVLAAAGDLDEIQVPPGELRAYAGNYDVVVVRLAHTVDRAVLEAGGRLRAVVTATTGLDHVDLVAARELGVEVLSLRGEFDFLKDVYATAEHTWAILLALLRWIPEAVQDVRNHHWNRDGFRGRELHGRTLGIVGLGRIGIKIARYGEAFGMDVRAFDPYRSEWPAGVERCTALNDLLAAADVVSLHVPLTPETTGMIGEDELTTMKAEAVLVNTSRGEIIQEEALLEALVARRVGGAALDVLAGERGLSAGAAHPLVEYARTNRNLIITPHLGGNTYESFEKTELFMAERVRTFLQRQGDRQ
jgi:D-3-phosphoglycerate dehydrogenase